MLRYLVFCLFFLAAATPLYAEEVTEQSLMRAATDLAKQYDTFYAAKNVEGMTKVYASDAILISPSGAIVRGTEGLTAYYQKRFASGAKDHATTINEVHVQGNGGYGIGHFAVTVPDGEGKTRREEGNLATVYQHKPMAGTFNCWCRASCRKNRKGRSHEAFRSLRAHPRKLFRDARLCRLETRRPGA